MTTIEALLADLESGTPGVGGGLLDSGGVGHRSTPLRAGFDPARNDFGMKLVL